MTIIFLNKKYRTIPTEWNELTQKQFLAVMETFFARQYTGEQAMLKLFKIIADLNYFQFFRTKPAEMEEFLYLVQFLLQEKTGLTKNLVPEFNNFYGPADDFDNLTMQELAIADGFFMQWTEDRENIRLLDQLCAILYRPGKKGYDLDKNPDGDPREEFNQYLCEWHANNAIRSWPLAVKLGIAYWYDGCRWSLTDNFEEVFGGDGSSDVSKYGMVSMMLSVAESHALGDFSKVEKHLVKTVLMHMNDSIAKAKAQEKANKV